MKSTLVNPIQSNNEISSWALRHLERVVAIDSASDERSQSIPTTPGQTILADNLAVFFASYGAEVERDQHSNVIATISGAGDAADQAPIALMVHLDTARGTAPVSGLNVLRAWDGSRVPYANNADLCVDADTYPDARAFLGHDIVHGPGDAPFGLDDKLGLTHIMTLARLLASNPGVSHPPLLLIGRPDEEVGRMDAVIGLAAELANRNVDFGFTVDGILPYEINLENFNASHATLRFADVALPTVTANLRRELIVKFGGVNTHGCTAKAEGYRASTRLCAEVVEVLASMKLAPSRITPLRFVSDELRDCDAEVRFAVRGCDNDELAACEAALAEAVATVVEPHVRRGASYSVAPCKDEIGDAGAGATWHMLDYVITLLNDDVEFAVAAEDSEGHQGYSNPYRAHPDGAVSILDVRIRDFSADGLARREAHLTDLQTGDDAASIEFTQQYVNMAARLTHRPDLLKIPQEAAKASGIEAPMMPIRGGTGVDPFLDAGVPIANLGTGYFAPESEKEFTSLQHMAGHARWLFALVQVVAQSRAHSNVDDNDDPVA